MKRAPISSLLAAVVGLAALAAPALAAPTPPQAAASTNRPNVVLFLVDDATVEDIEYMPRVQSLLVDRGTTFTRTYSPFPICCPARATILTGRYPHNHRVLDNVAPLGGFTQFQDADTLSTYLTRHYATAYIGKYLNDYDNQRYVPPGWDTFKAATDPSTYNYVNQTMNINGRLRSFSDTYTTTLYARQARSFIRSTATSPYFVYLSWVAPHTGTPHESASDPLSPYVAPRYQDTYTGPLRPRDPSFNEADVSDKPAVIQRRSLLTEAQIAAISEKLAQRRESLRSVDDEVARTVRRIAELGQLDNTYFIFTSDNGQMQGQHRLGNGKSVSYEPSARVPLIIRGPGVPRGADYAGVTGLQDLTPTILDMTNTPADVAGPIDGVSVLRLLNGSLATDRPQLIERTNSSRLSDAQIARGLEPSPAQAAALTSVSWVYRGLVTPDNWKYVRYLATGEIEMYDLDTDPYELENLAGKPQYADRQSELAALLKSYQFCSGLACR
jgi:arylsulfatase A-like enzyme